MSPHAATRNAIDDLAHLREVLAPLGRAVSAQRLTGGFFGIDEARAGQVQTHDLHEKLVGVRGYADPTGDVLSGSDTPGLVPTDPAPDRANGDIISSTVNHKRRKLVLQMQFRDLEANRENNIYIFAIRTGTMKRYVRIYGGPSHRPGSCG